MTKRIRSITNATLQTLILSILCLLFSSFQAHALEVNGIRFGQHTDKSRLVVELSSVQDFRVFTLDSPYRLVVDLPRFAWKTSMPAPSPSNMMRELRQGPLNPTMSRIVLDLTDPVSVQSAFTLPGQNNKGARLVIDYKKVSSAQFSQTKSQVHGTLTPDATQEATAAQGIPTPPANIKRPQATKTVIKKPLIVLDPGHGGQDPGAHSANKIYEKHIVLALSKEIKRQLLETGRYDVILTRETDHYIRLKDRVAFAQKHNADLFMSIHADSIHKSHVRGSSIYTISQKASDAQTAKLAASENQSDLMAGIDLSIEDEQVAFILGDFLMNDTMNQSKYFANTLVDTFQKHDIRTLDRAHRYAGFAVLKAPNIPSVLIEAGFLSNKSEAQLLNTDSHRRKIAKSIVSGVNAYFENVRLNEQN